MRKLRRRDLLSGAVAGLMTGLPLVTKDAMANQSAKAQGFRQPEESEPHLRTFMQWPVSRRVYDDPVFLEMVQQSIADIANTISEFEPVVMLMHPERERAARRMLSDQIDIWPVPTDDLWCRDSGPLFVRDERDNFAISQMNFNGWGNKQSHANDGKVAQRVAEILDLKVFDNGLVGEPGGVESDGEGTLIAHESSWVNRNRNSGSRQHVENLMMDALGAEKVIWAPGVAGEDITDYHIDSLARFVAPGKVLIQLPEAEDSNDLWTGAALETYDILQNAVDAQGRRLDIDVIEEPLEPRVEAPDFVASYVNYYVCNGGVIAAEFGDRDRDRMAQSLLADLYPDREVVMLNVDPIGEFGGGIHCATQQQPA